MIWWGKIIGVILGWGLGGWLGAAVGLLLGHHVDRRWPGWDRFLPGLMHLRQSERVQDAFFTASFSVMGHVAKADGRVSEREIAMARVIMARMDLSDDAIRHAMALFTQGKEPTFPLKETVYQFRRASRGQHNLLQMFLEIQFEAACADGELKPAQRAMLINICDWLGFTGRDFTRLEAMGRAECHSAKGAGKVQSLDDAYGMLNVAPTATDAEVTKAYRRLLSQHHPDKLLAKGLPEQMMKLAEEKTREIRSAYDFLRQQRGF